jgi:hypothetical protein
LNNTIAKVILFLCSCIFLFSCKYFQKDQSDQQEPVAKVYDYNLYPEDLAGVVPYGSPKEDSISIVKNYIDNWSRQKAMLHMAEKELSEEKKDVSKELDEYRNSLITYAFETEVISKKLDTTVAEEEVSAFYKTHPQNFELKDNIIRVIYLKLGKKSPKLDKVREWYKSDLKKDRNSLEDYCHQYAINYFLDDTTWLLFDDLLKEIPIKTYDQEQFLQNNRNIEIEDSSMIYMVSIKGFMIKDSMSPLSFERKNIVAMIVNQRKRQLIDDTERKAYEDAKNSGKVEIISSPK